MGRSGELFSKNDSLINELILNDLYDVREDGSVWTRICRTGKISVGGIWRKAGSITADGYAHLSYNYNHLQIHRIIYAKFVGPLEEDLVINHINGNRSDNRPENLELVSQSENNTHRFRVLKRKPVIGNKKISREIADEIRKDRSMGMTYKELMAKYSLAKSSISYICNNLTWNRND